MTTSEHPSRALILPDRDFVSVSGVDASTFLNGLISNDVTKVGPHQGIYAALLTPQGKYLFDFFICGGGDQFLIDLDGGRGAELAKRLSLYKLRAKVTIENVSDQYQVIAIDDANVGSDPVQTQFPDPRNPVMGQRWIVPSDKAPDIASRFAVWDYSDYRHRMIEQCIPDHGRDLIVDKTFLMDANFDALCGVDFKKGCYVGQELTARMKHRAGIRRQFLGVQMDAPLADAGTIIEADGREVGIMATGIGTTALANFRMDKLAEHAGHALLADNRPVTLMNSNTGRGDQ